MSSSYNFNITQGCSFLVYLNATNSDGTKINLSGYAARGIVRDQYSDIKYILNLNPTPIEPFDSGVLLISGAAQDTLNLPVGEFLYDIEITSSNYGLKVAEGSFVVNPSTYVTGVFVPPSFDTQSVVISSGNLTLSNASVYIFNGNSNVNWIMPTSNTSIGTLYYVKNRGSATINVTGINGDTFYLNQYLHSLNVNSGESYIMISDGQTWNIN